MTETKKDGSHFLSESPIELSKQDLLNYKHYAEKVRKVVQNNANNPEPLTIGVYGKWGEGKTSFMNLVENQVDLFEKNLDGKGIMKYHFNPWRYGSEDEMLFAFFQGLAQKLFLTQETNLKTAGNYILKFSRYLKAIKLSASVGVPKLWGAKVTFTPSEIFEALGEDIKGEELSLESFKEKIDDTLEKARWKILVFIDDIDRLDKDEIYTLLKIVKLNADFKNLVYLITMDPDQVSKAIKVRYGEDNMDGELFLEKIINIPIHLPKIEKVDFRLFFEKKLEQVFQSYIGNSNNAFFNKKKLEIEEINEDYEHYQFKTPREVIRVLNSFYLGMFAIGDEVHLRDLFWIEYLKIKDDKCYKKIKDFRLDEMRVFEPIISFNDYLGSTKTPNGLRKNLLEEYDSFSIIEMLFPDPIKSPIEDFEKSKRVNHEEHFDKYFSFHMQGKIPEIKILKYIELVKLEKYEDAKGLLKELSLGFDNKKILYRIEFQLDEVKKDVELYGLIHNLLDNRDLFNDNDNDLFSPSTRIRMIENLAVRLENRSENVKNISLEVADKLDYMELSFFTRKFKNIDYKIELESKILNKVKALKEEQQPFFKYPKNIMNKMVMEIWKGSESEKFKQFVKEHLNTKENIGLLVRNFPGYWDNKFFGVLTQDNYKYMKSLIDTDLVFEKISEHYSVSIDKTQVEKWDDLAPNSVQDNVDQFIYEYQKEKELESSKQSTKD